MTEGRFTQSDDEPLAEDDLLAQALRRLPSEAPTRDLWPGVAARIGTAVPRAPRRPSFTWGQLAAAASLLVAVSSGLTWLAARPPRPAPRDAVVLAEGESAGTPAGRVVPANFADAAFDRAVSDLERILRADRGRLDPRTIVVIERNLRTIDAAIGEARRALDNDPSNPYLNSHLADARRRKLDLLRRAADLTSMGGD